MASPVDNGQPQPEEVDGDPQILNVQNLEYSDYLDMPVFTQRNIITSQPTVDVNPNRRPIPIPTVDWVSTTMSHMVPPSGLDFLRGVTELQIQQTVELDDILAYVESENRFQVKVPHGETLYVASESSSNTQRMCCGSNRGFEMRLFDHSQQEAIRFTRNLACGNWVFGCSLQELQVFSDVDLYVGRVMQEWSMTPSFQLISASNRIMFRLIGPKSATTCCGSNYQAQFDVDTELKAFISEQHLPHNGHVPSIKLLNPECTMKLGSIVHAWDENCSDYILAVTFPTSGEITVTNEMKAVILGAAFLLEYMYFETPKRRGCISCRTC